LASQEIALLNLVQLTNLYLGKFLAYAHAKYILPSCFLLNIPPLIFY